MSIGLPPAQGLYDPRNEHDSCGVGFIVDLKGRKSHQIVRDGLTALQQPEPPRSVRDVKTTPATARGCLIQIPHEFLRSRCCAHRDRAARAPSATAWVHSSPRPTNRSRSSEWSCSNESSLEEGQNFLGWRRIETDGSSLGESAAAVEPRHVARVHRHERRRSSTPTGSSESSTSSASGSKRRSNDSGLDDHTLFLFLEPLVPHAGLQGNAHDRAARPVLRRRPRRPALRQRSLHVSLAVQHQHVPELAARPPLSHDLAQRRNQHLARQHQLDEGARGALCLGPL